MLFRIECIGQTLINGAEFLRLTQNLGLSNRKQIDHDNSNRLCVSDLLSSELNLPVFVRLDVQNRVLSSAKEIEIGETDVL